MTGRDAEKPHEVGLQEEAALSEMIRRGELFNKNCPSREILKHLTSRWGVLVLIALLERNHRFSELRRTVGGVSEKMLAQTLQTLEADGFVNRYSRPVVPPHVDYSLTPIGHEVAMKVRDFADWIELNISRILASKPERSHSVDA
ncbi:MAG: helix-turn-helix transcriptional regulator [Roseibium sp.]|uniref:winged helix-turn-helix transcriptional regulator n=1 Tax=Roseibium sp. TaxID=1936156 RepID=UPI00260A7CD3|nr:helix-turn-helix domain-containing protein [Roseibium sp.]MCV0426106.1 helix-turn-helix transcriptional regulator [Roseibium sp.]